MTAHTSGYVRVMEIEPVEARRYSFKETKIGNKLWDLSILGGTIKTINGKEAGESEGNAYSGQRVSLIANELEDNQAFLEWQILLSPDDFVLKHPKEKGISFQMPEGDVTLKARYKTASPSEATAAFEANPKGWAYAEQDSLDQLLDSEDVITDSDKELMNNGGSTAVTVSLLKKDVSDQNGLVKKIKELWGNSFDLTTVFLMENSLSKAQKQKDGTTKAIPLASASEAVRVCMSVPDQWQDLDKDDFVLLHYNNKEDLEPTVTNTIFDWIGERRIEFDADVNGTYALVVPAVYTVTFKNYNGAVLKEVKVKSGEAATPPEDPQREGYIFYGWDKDFKEITKDLTVTAVFKKETAQDGIIKRLQGILDDLNDLEPDGVIETELAVKRIVKQVIAMDYSAYTNSEDVMELLEEIEEKIIDFSGIEPPYVKNSSSYSSVSVNGALFGLEGESGYLKVEDAPVSASLPKGVKKLFHAHAFDAKLYTDKGIKKNVKGLLKITLDLPEDIDSNEDIVVIHYDDGSSEGKRLNYSLSGDQILIITDSLSTFTIANVNIRTSDRSESESSDDNDVIRTEAAGIWQRAEKGWKYRNNDRSYAENCWKKIFYNGTYFWYYFGADGYMATGWLEEADGHLYYLEETKDKTEGIMATGWKNIEGKWYYFNTVSDGTMGRLFRSGITPDGYSVGENGSWIK